MFGKVFQRFSKTFDKRSSKAASLRASVKMPSKRKSVLGKVLWILRVIFDYFSTILFGFIYKNKEQPLPPIKDLILLESATSLAEKIRKRKVKSEDVVKAYISRIEEVNPIINAVVDNRFEDAIRDAQYVDKLVASGKKSEDELAAETPFLGVPYTTKECFNTKGLHRCAGLVASKDFIAEEDAPAMQLMKNAGAILLGVTNTSELCMWWESQNKVYGRTCNPYKTTRIVGGSSGGEAATIAAAASVMGVGSDIGGSIRMPCFFNGIFGHKPSVGMVPIDGQIPKCEGELRNYLTVGPMCRYASDLMPMFKVLAQHNSHKLKLDQRVNLSKLRIYYMEDDGGIPIVSPVHPELKAAMKKVVYHFEEGHGIKAENANIREFFYSLGIWGCKMDEGSIVKFSELLGHDAGPINVKMEFLKWLTFTSNHTLPALLLAVGEKLSNKDPSYVSHMHNKYLSLRSRLSELLGQNGVLLYPTHPNPAPYHNQPVFQAFNFAYTAIFNTLGFPSTQCPLGLGSTGVPLGLQVIGNLHCDHITLAVAVELEKAFGGWIPPCPTP